MHNLANNFNCSRDGTANLLNIFCKQKEGIHICHINAQSLCNKVDELRYIFENSSVDIVCISETWFSSRLHDEQINMEGYQVFRSDRVSHAGGVAIYSRKHLKCKRITSQPANSEVEYLFLEIASLDGTKTLLGCIYRPNCNIDLNSFYDIVSSFHLCYENIVLVGDFNANLLVDRSSQILCLLSGSNR